tara:strand:+ start:194 stop:1180 length:987 start_codon:yes stop_codon:yes gene_type:complete
MRVLLTGGAGYIGSHTALSLIDSGYDVTIVDDLSTGNEKLIPNKAEFINCNINDTKKINSIFKKKIAAVMHFAGFIEVEESVQNPNKYFKNNTQNAIKFFETCLNNNLENIIFSSTAAIYGNTNSHMLISEKNILKPINPYGESKLKTEQFILNVKKNNYNYIILRYFNVAGADPKMRSGLISDKPTHLIKIACEAATGKRENVLINGTDYNTPDGSPIRDYIHVSDLAEIHVKALEYMVKNNQSEIFNCGYGKGYSVKEVLKTTNKITKNKVKIINGPRRKGDAEFVVSNPSKLKQMIDWNPKYNKLEYIIQTGIDWELKLKNEKIS